ncbi:ppsB, partial [Symbiodinium sp. KB8]
MVHSQVPPNLHLASLNPHMDIEDVKFSFPTEAVVELSRETLRTFGLSSFGFGGTNTHVTGLAPAGEKQQEPTEDKIVFNRQRFGWSQTKHPLSVAPRKGGEPGLQVFSAPIRGK